MTWKLVGSATAAVVLLAFSASFDSAEARRHGGGHFRMGGGHHHHFRHHHVFHHRHFRHHRFHGRRFVVAGVYPYYYADGCYWLKRRALYTGSPYWWRRYYACRYGYYY